MPSPVAFESCRGDVNATYPDNTGDVNPDGSGIRFQG